MVKRDTRRIKAGDEVESDWGEDSVITLASSEDVTLKGRPVDGQRGQQEQEQSAQRDWNEVGEELVGLSL